MTMTMTDDTTDRAPLPSPLPTTSGWGRLVRW